MQPQPSYTLPVAAHATTASSSFAFGVGTMTSSRVDRLEKNPENPRASEFSLASHGSQQTLQSQVGPSPAPTPPVPTQTGGAGAQPYAWAHNHSASSTNALLTSAGAMPSLQQDPSLTIPPETNAMSKSLKSIIGMLKEVLASQNRLEEGMRAMDKAGSGSIFGGHIWSHQDSNLGPVSSDPSANFRINSHMNRGMSARQSALMEIRRASARFSGATAIKFGDSDNESSDTDSLASAPFFRSSGETSAFGLDRNWPTMIKLRDDLLQQENERVSIKNISRSLVVSNGQSLFSAHRRESFAPPAQRFLHEKHWIPVDPSCSGVLVFDIIGILVLLHDIIVSSYVVALEVEIAGVALVFAWLSTLYWASDFCMRWVTGFYDKGELIMDLHLIRRQYMRSWCILDATMLVCDGTATGMQIGGANAGPLVFIAKFARTLRLFRVARLIRTLNKVTTLMVSNSIRSLMQGFNIVLGILIYNHLVCCSWCALGKRSPSFMPTTWLDNAAYGGVALSGGEMSLRNVPAEVLYVTSLHWTLAQMTPGNVDVVASNPAEKVFNVILLILGLLFTSFIVSLFSGHLMQHIIKRRANTQSLETMRRFLAQQGIRTRLATRVQRQIIGRLAEEAPLKAQDVSGFAMLSPSLRSELLYEMRIPHLLTHSLFSIWSDLDEKEVATICWEVVDNIFVSQQEELFAPRAEARGAYICTSGLLKYTTWPESDSGHEMVRDVRAGTWIAEAALWSHWPHQGHMEAATATQLLHIDAGILYEVLKKCPTGAVVVRQYGINFHKRITQAMPPHAHYPDDLAVPYTEASNLLSFRVSLGLFDRAIAEGTLHLDNKQATALRNEIKTGMCSIHLSNTTGKLERMVTLVAARIRHRDREDFFLTRVGQRTNEGRITGVCLLPGAKLMTGESVQQGLDRLLSSKDLRGLVSDVVFTSFVQERESSESRSLGLPTTYLKTTHDAVCDLPEGSDCDDLGSELSHRDIADWPIEPRPLFQRLTTDGQRMYAWLSSAEFEQLSSGKGKEEWSKWLSHTWAQMKPIPI